MKKIRIAAVAVLITLILSGCTAQTNGKTYAQSRVDLMFDDAEFVKNGDTERKVDSCRWEYIFSYKDIEFTVTERQDAYWDVGFVTIWDAHIYSSDYGRGLREYLTEDKLAELSGGALDENKLWIEKSGDSHDVPISYRMASVDELPQTVQAFKDIYDTIWEYLPESSGDRDEGTVSFTPHVRFWLSVPSDDDGNYDLPADNMSHWESGYIPVMMIYSKADVIDWEEVETLVRYKYFTVNNFMAEKGIKSPVEMSDEDKKLIERNDDSFKPVYYPENSCHAPSVGDMTKDIPKYER